MPSLKEVTNNLDIITEALEAFGTPVTDRSHLYKDKVIVDVGCGTGFMVQEMARQGAKVIGIDTAGMIKKAKKCDHATYYEGKGENLPLENEIADVVIFFASLHHITDHMMDALKESYRVLKKGGLTIIVEPVYHAGSWSELSQLLGDEIPCQADALAAIKHAGKLGFTHKKEEPFYFSRTLDHFYNQLKDHVDDEEKRQEYYNQGKKKLAELSENAHVAPADYRFKSHCRLNILKKE